jgi:hypothetical protein
MITRTRFVVAVLWILSLSIAANWDHEPTAAQGDPMVLQRAVLYSGSDVGVSVYQPTGGSKPVATLMIKVAGRWQEVELRPTKTQVP